MQQGGHVQEMTNGSWTGSDDNIMVMGLVPEHSMVINDPMTLLLSWDRSHGHIMVMKPVLFTSYGHGTDPMTIMCNFDGSMATSRDETSPVSGLRERLTHLYTSVDFSASG